jgi:hypothetical protein
MCSDKECKSSGKETVPSDSSEMVHLLICGNECHTVDVSIVLDLTVNLVDEEGFHCVVEFVLI